MIKAAISPSLMCADLLNLQDTINRLAKLNVPSLHIDVMDGEFVPNIMLGTELIKNLKKRVNIPLDLHLMIKNPENKLDWFEFSHGDIVSVHFESSDNIEKALTEIKNRNAFAYLALNPDTELDEARKYFDLIDGLLIMTVYPGHSGQKIVGKALEKIAVARKMLDDCGKSNARIEVDGCAGFEYAPVMRRHGADTFVAGTSSVFGKENSIEENYRRLEEALK